MNEFALYETEMTNNPCNQSQLEEKEHGVKEKVASLTEELEMLRRQLREQVVPTTEQPVAASPPKPEPPLLEREDGEVCIEETN